MSDDYIIALIIIAGISVLSSLLVIFSLLLFSNLRNQPFVRIIGFISAADLLGNIAYLRYTRPAAGSPACIIESFFNLACYPCSWTWTAALVYFLYILATEKRMPRNFNPFYALCFGIPLAFFLISIPFSTFQQPGAFSFEVCTVSGEAGIIYHDITYYGMFFLCLGRMIYFFYQIKEVEAKTLALSAHRPQQQDSSDSSSTANGFSTEDPAFLVAKAALQLYPLSLIICWLPHVMMVIIFSAFDLTSYTAENFYYYGDLLKISHGTVAAAIFFWKSAEARKQWYQLLGARFFFVFFCWKGSHSGSEKWTMNESITQNPVLEGVGEPVRMSEIEIKERASSHAFY